MAGITKAEALQRKDDDSRIHEEGLRLEPYHDVAGFPTIGVGTSCQ